MKDGNFIKVSISFPESLLKEIDEVCREEGYTRSELVRIAVRRFLTYRKLGKEEVGA